MLEFFRPAVLLQRNTRVGFCSLLCTMVLAACTAETEAPVRETTATIGHTSNVVVRDFLGREVRLPKPAERIVALAPHIVENLFSIGAGGQIVGVVSYSDFPPAAKAIPVVGSFNAVGLEAVLALQPDLIVLWGSGNGLNALKGLEALNIPVYVDEMENLADIPKSLVNLGVLSGHAEAAEAKATRFSDSIAALKSMHELKNTISVFYQVWNEPLQTINGAHIISEIIGLCGGENIFSAEPVLAPKVNQEAVIARNPDAIIASGVSEQRPDWLNEWNTWPELSAVKNQHLFFVPPDIIQRHTLRIQQGAELMCEKLNLARS